MALGRRCDLGCETWPDDDRYDTCPECREETTRYSNVKAITAEEASAREFELFYEAWDAAHDPARLAGDAVNAAGRFARSKGS